jgi:hypothetical protein
MSRLRFSLAGLLVFTLFVAFICAALRYATDLWASAAVSLTGVLLLLGLLAAFLRPAARPFWIGFALFGLAYGYVSIGPGSVSLHPRLVTSHLLRYLDSEPQSEQAYNQMTSALLGFSGAARYRLAMIGSPAAFPVPGNVQTIGHSGLAILIALLGGVAGHLIGGGTSCRGSRPSGASTPA